MSQRTILVRPGRRTAAGLALVLLLGVLVGSWLPGTARAAQLVATEPLARQELDDPPGWVTLAFGFDVDAGVAKVIVANGNGENVTSGALIVEGTNVTTQLRSGLDKGTYTVHYRVNGSKGKPQGGAYQFAYGKGSFTALPDSSWSGSDNEPAVLRGSNPNASDGPEPPPGATEPPGVQVTRTGPPTEPASTTSNPQPTDAPTQESTQAPPSGSDSPTDQPSSAAGTPTTSTDGPSKTPFVVGGILALAALGGGAYGVYRTRNPKGHE